MNLFVVSLEPHRSFNSLHIPTKVAIHPIHIIFCCITYFKALGVLKPLATS